MKTIILHGWGESKTYWQNIVDRFSDSRDIVAIDLPGFGEEARISDDAFVEDYANWVIKKILERKESQIILIGYSFGGRIASKIAAKRPKCLRGLVLIASPCIYRPQNKMSLKIYTYKFLKPFLPNSIRRKFYSDDLKEAEVSGMGKIFRNIVRDDQTKILPNINVPTYIIWGEDDKATRLEIGKEIHELIPNSKLEVLPNVGHHINLEAPNLLYGKLNWIFSKLDEL